MCGYVHPQWNNRRLLEATTAADESALPEAEVEEREEPDWEQIGPSEILLSGLRIIAYSASSPKSRHDCQLHTEILRRVVKCGTISLLEALAVEKGQRGLEALPEEDPEKDPEVEVWEVQELD